MKTAVRERAAGLPFIKPARRRTGLLAAFVILAIALLSATWVFGNPPGAAPDETAQYFRAVAIGRGQLNGQRTTYPLTEAPNFGPHLGYYNQVGRVVDVPGNLRPADFDCAGGQPNQSAACQGNSNRANPTAVPRTNEGITPPYVYAAPGVLMRLAHHPGTALYLGRAAIAVISVLLLGLAVVILWSGEAGDSLSLVGLLAAITPQLLFLCSSLTASAPEIAGGVCFAAALMRLYRDGECRPLTSLALGVGGTIMVAARQPAPGWVVWDGLLIVALMGGRGAWQAIRRSGRHFWWAAGAVAIGGFANVVWQAAHPIHVPHQSLNTGSLLVDAVKQPFYMVRETVGSFGILDTKLPMPVYGLWWVMVGAVVIVAARVATSRQRRVLAGLIVACLALIVFGHIWLVVTVTYGLQARLIFPALVSVPMLAGEIILQHRARLTLAVRRRVVIGVAAVVAVVHGAAFVINSRRYAVGTGGSWLFFLHSQWNPPLGWWPWIAALSAAVILLVASAKSHGATTPLQGAPGA